MPYLNSLPDQATVADILKLNKPAGRALVAYHDEVMRQPSELDAADRELLAAFVSSLNGCQYCLGVHGAAAAAFGVSEELLKELVDDPDASDVDDRLKPIFAFAAKLTQSPSRVVRADVDSILEAGWSEQTVHDVINVVCLYNFMNRLLDGHGVTGDAGLFATRGKAVREGGYAPLLAALEDC